MKSQNAVTVTMRWCCDADQQAEVDQAEIAEYDLADALDSKGLSVIVVGVTVSNFVTPHTRAKALKAGKGEEGSKMRAVITVTWVERVSVGFNPGAGPFSWDIGLSLGGETKVATKKYVIVVDCCRPKAATSGSKGKVSVQKQKSWIKPYLGLYQTLETDHDGWDH